jgi:phage shock protein C
MTMRNTHATWRKGLYRSRSGLIFGVCRGLADCLGFSVFWMRVIFALLFFFTGFFPIVVVYFVGALLMKPEPVLPFETEADREFYDSYASSRSMAIHRLKRTYGALDRRIRRIESIVTSRDFDWDKRMNG